MPGLTNVAVLNEFLADKSYIVGFVGPPPPGVFFFPPDGAGADVRARPQVHARAEHRFQPSAADAVVFEAHAPYAPDATEYVHAARWYKHISSFGEKRHAFPGERQAISAYGPADGVDEEAEAAVEAEEPAKAAPAAKETKPADDDEIDLFGSDDEEVDEEAERIKAERLAAYEAKKATKPVVIAKSSLLLDVKPWDDETDMKAMEEGVRAIATEGLLWGASKLIPVAFGVKKLQIMATVEDDKVSVDWLEEQIVGLEDHVQSMDIAAFNKI